MTSWTRMLGNAATLLAADFLALTLALIGGDLAMYWTYGEAVSLKYSLLLLPAWGVGALAQGIAPGWGINAAEELRRVERLNFLLFAMAGVVVFVSGMASAANRGSFVVAFLLAAALIPPIRHVARGLAVRCGAWGTPVVIYGGGSLARSVADALSDDPTLGYRPTGVFGPEGIGSLPRLGDVGDRADDVAIAFLADDSLQHDRLTELIDGPLSRYRRVIVMPGLLETPSLWAEPRDYHGLFGLELSNHLLDPQSKALKRVADLTVALVIAPVWLPLCGLIMVAVFLSDRKFPLYAQPRIGRGGKAFRMWKFRTMTPDAERQLAERIRVDPAIRAEWEAGHKLRDDWRITRIGRVLRRWSLDELPQLWNVLLGDMSLVGPRPLPEYHLRTLSSAAIALRERVMPGLTGLWQIRGRSELDADELARWDSYYVRNWSIWLDLLILIRTLRAVALGRGAY